jgi:HAD superfamily phosphoserine phosphatase-like hydrolase
LANPSAAQFVESVLALRPLRAALDCDGTLWSGDAGQDFFYWSIERQIVPDEVATRALPRYSDYKAGKVGEEEMCGEMVTLYQGLSEAGLRQAAESFFREQVEARIFPEMRELTRRLAQAGCELWAVSSTNQWVIEAGAARFGIPAERVLAAAAAIEDGRVTGRLLRVPTGEGKVRVIRQHIRGPVDASFGNSIHDAAMLSLARHAFAVNPNPDLEKIAQLQGWPIYRPSC